MQRHGRKFYMLVLTEHVAASIDYTNECEFLFMLLNLHTDETLSLWVTPDISLCVYLKFPK